MVPASRPVALWLGVETLLQRTVRFAAEGRATRGPNGYAGSPPLRAMGPFIECSVTCRGKPDPASGYLLDIKRIDEAVHRHVRPRLERARLLDQPPHLASLLAESLDALAGALPVAIDRIELALSPYHAVAMASTDRQHAEVRLRFDFAAAHRLHVPAWSDQANREHFGKCNNPNGHGHNYQLEVRVTLPTDLPTADREAGPHALPIDALEHAVQGAVIDRFDHKHLNLDTAEFAQDTGLNPTVENIARVCYGLLTGPIAGLGRGVTLRSVRVWETDRTSSRYPA